MARIVNGTEVPEIEPKFTKWLCSGNKKLFTNEEAEHAWQIWCFIKERSFNSYVLEWEDDNQIDCIWYVIEPYKLDESDEWSDSEDYNRFKIKLSNHNTDTKYVSKIDFFSWILENSTPELLTINSGFHNPEPRFQFSDIDDITIDIIKEKYGWRDESKLKEL
jgi:hypothetical protein